MGSLTTTFPNVEVLLALEPEELAGPLLRLAADLRQNGLVLIERITHQVDGHVGSDDVGYPQSHRGQAKQATAEAWNWLRSQGLLIPDEGTNGMNGHMRLSRRAEALLDKGASFYTYRQASAFPKSLLHQTIADEVWLDLLRGDLDTAVFKSFKAVEVAVREVGKFPPTEIGTNLMRRAFDKGIGPLTDMTQPEAERESLAHLYAGAIGWYKNPHSHRTVTINDPVEAREMVMLASHLLRIVDSRRGMAGLGKQMQSSQE